MTFDLHVMGIVLEQYAHRAQRFHRFRRQARIGRVEQYAGIDFHAHAPAVLRDAHLALLDQWRQRGQQVLRQPGHLLPLLFQHFGAAFQGGIGDRQVRHLRVDRRRRAGAAKGVAQRIGKHLVLADVDRRDRIHHDKEREQQRNEVGVRDQPALVVFHFLVEFFSGAPVVHLSARASRWRCALRSRASGRRWQYRKTRQRRFPAGAHAG